MTKLIGSLVGASVANAGAIGFAGVPPRFKDCQDPVIVRDLATCAGNLIGDTISLGTTFKSNCFLNPSDSWMWWAAFGASCTISIGDVNHPAGLCAGGFSVSSAGNGPLIQAFTPAKMGQPLWQMLGYASDPGGMLELLLTFAGANPANVAFAWQFIGQNN